MRRSQLTGAVGMYWRAVSGALVLRAMCAGVEASSLAAGAADIHVADFEGADCGGWRVAGDAFGSRPARGAPSGQQGVSGFQGKGPVNSFLVRRITFLAAVLIARGGATTWVLASGTGTPRVVDCE